MTDMLRMPAAITTSASFGAITPPDWASRSSTNPNSPNCASPTPASQATRAGKRIASAATVANTPLTATNPRKRSATSRGARTRMRGSRSMPSEMKKMLTKASRSGRTSLIARWRKRVSATATPPRNAPSASERPASEVIQAVPMQMVRTESKKSSRLRAASTQASTRGTTTRATISTTTTASAALPRETASAPAPPPPPRRSGTASTIGTTQRSWKIKTPTMKRPCGASSSPRSPSKRSTMAVLERAKTNPRTTAAPRGRPPSRPMPVTTSAVSPT